MDSQMPGSALGFEAVQVSRSGGSSDVVFAASLVVGVRCGKGCRYVIVLTVFGLCEGRLKAPYDTTLDGLFRCHR